ALRRVMDRLVERHEALRTTFYVDEGQPVQRIGAVEDSRFALAENDLRGEGNARAELERLAAQEAGEGFDLQTGPLIRGRLIRVGEEEHVLLITMHHIVSDGWSMGVLINELNVLYGAFLRGEEDPLAPLEIQYGDYAVWQRKWIEGERLRQQGEYWKRTLGGAPGLLEVPMDRARPAQQDYAGGFVGLELEEKLTVGLSGLSRRHGVTQYMTLLAGWAALLARLSGQRDVVIGTPVAGRGRVEIENLIGLFINTLAVRVEMSSRMTVGELVLKVKEQVIAAQQHQDIPFEQVIELLQPERSLAHSPLFQVMFAWQNAPQGTFKLPGLEVQPLRLAPYQVAKCDLTLWLQESGGRIEGGVGYATALFERGTVERYAGYLRRLLEGMVV
ncbi:MAG TPA: condensation domain-containing protein, partial [Gemmatimonadales bacterium]|nr:condensation domain-containing protein [Gemmatimonadales bacterium]